MATEQEYHLCDNGHKYQASFYASCPWCDEESQLFEPVPKKRTEQPKEKKGHAGGTRLEPDNNGENDIEDLWEPSPKPEPKPAEGRTVLIQDKTDFIPAEKREIVGWLVLLP